MTILGLALFALSSLRERAIETGVLRAIGFTRREVIAFLGWELLVILLFGLGAGTCIGIWTSRVFIPYLQAGIEPTALLLPLAPQIAWPRVYQVYLVLALLYFGSTFAANGRPHALAGYPGHQDGRNYLKRCTIPNRAGRQLSRNLAAAAAVQPGALADSPLSTRDEPA